MFIRTKKVKSYEYAYIVANKWKKGKVKQKTKKYLGRVHRFEKTSSAEFLKFYNIRNIDSYLKNSSKYKIMKELIQLELHNHGFHQHGDVWQNKGAYVDTTNLRIFSSKGRNIALAFNEGFLTSYTLRQIMKIKPHAEEDVYKLAKAFVESGINIPKDIFIGLYGKL
jgi:hypothetical protein